MVKVDHRFSLFTEEDIYFFREGTHSCLYRRLGSHPVKAGGVDGTYFAVWASNATAVTVMGDFNGWDRSSHPLRPKGDGSGIWEGFIAGVGVGSLYKYHIVSQHRAYRADKGDPFAFHWQVPPGTASIVWDLSYRWGDGEWMEERARRNGLDAPISIYEVHLGSWKRVHGEGDMFLNYREMAPILADYLFEMGFTHVEFLPVMEHPFYGSWGYQVTGYFAPTSRYGTPQDFMYLIDHLHQRGIGVILDWVPSHYPGDGHGLVYFDGTHLFEHEDPKKGFHPDWKSHVFNYGRNEVAAFLISSACFWLDLYHADGLRVNGVASMLYLDYSRKEGEWIPSECGGRENLEAIRFLKRLNETVYRDFPHVQTIAEESTAWPMVSRPTHIGGFGFGMKWNMGWMHDTIQYFSMDPIYRKYHHEQLTFSIWYAFSENFLLPLSHDEVVYGKGSLLRKMGGEEWQRFAALRLLLGYMFAHPGKKLLFMGGEFGQVGEWNHEEGLEWHLLDRPFHRGLQRWVQDLNRLYREDRALHELDFEAEGFERVDFHDSENGVLSFLRKGRDGGPILVVGNFTPVPRTGYRVGVPVSGFWQEVINSDPSFYGGSDMGNLGGLYAEAIHFIHPANVRSLHTLEVSMQRPYPSTAGNIPSPSYCLPLLSSSSDHGVADA